MQQLTMGSLFDGSGGFPLASMLSGIRPVWSSEIEPFPILVTSKNIPSMKHYGDIRNLKGSELEPVDIITFGSPCQDLSLAGGRAGLDGERSGLFHEAIRVIKEMREATNEVYPKYLVWENVRGAFSSSKGKDFQSVLEELCSIKSCRTPVPLPENGKWPKADILMADGFSIAWRLFDAQHWGVPQRRNRIYLVADLDGRSAGKILFESEGLSGYSAESFRAWQRTARTSGQSPESTGWFVPLDHHPTDSRLKIIEGDHVNTLTNRMGTGGNCVPLLLKIRSGGPGGGKGALIQKDKSATISCLNDQTLFKPVYSTSKANYHCTADKELAGSLMESDWKDPPLVGNEYLIRKLTPTECARLQGFPDWWCSHLEITDQSEEQLQFWMDVFEEKRLACDPDSRPKTEKQVRKWLSDPHTDSAEYRMWGNGIALPCAWFVMAAIAWADRQSDSCQNVF